MLGCSVHLLPEVHTILDRTGAIDQLVNRGLCGQERPIVSVELRGEALANIFKMIEECPCTMGLSGSSP